MTKRIIVCTPGSENIASRLTRGSGLRLHKAKVRQYPDGEISVAIDSRVGKNSIVVASEKICWEEIGRTLLASKAALDLGGRVELFFPMMPYGRSDKAPAGEAAAAYLVAGLFSSLPIDAVSVIAPHSLPPLESFGCGVNAVEPLPNMAAAALGVWRPDTILSPDRGGIPRALEVKNCLGVLQLSWIDKKRVSGGRVIARDFRGKIGKRVLIVDDIVSTGKTLALAALEARRRGASEIRALAVHGIFSGGARSLIARSALKELIVSDSVLPKAGGKIKTMAILEDVGKLLYRR
jgi:ribose-phosphate pyrophosphokinase